MQDRPGVIRRPGVPLYRGVPGRGGGVPVEGRLLTSKKGLKEKIISVIGKQSGDLWKILYLTHKM